MGYQKAMEAAGATVLEYKSFGSYQGDWWALVTFEGRTFWVHGYYGSCSGCDAFEAEFGYSEPACETHKYDYPRPDNCAECKSAEENYNLKLAQFGRRYLDANDWTEAEVIAKLEQDAADYDWDGSYGEALEFVKSHPTSAAA